MILKAFKFLIIVTAGIFVSSCSSGNGVMSMFSGNPARTVQVAIKDGNAKQLRNAWDQKALSLCKSGYNITNLGKVVSTAGGHNSLSGLIACK
tara:strand:- start:11 stop:289 length:279 start_codon:yes stop_codon:yes gene_type:complete